MSEYEFISGQLQFGKDRDLEREAWQRAALHREMVTRVLTSRPPSGGKLAVWGAGPCNDLALPVLHDWYSEIHLFDLNGLNVWNGVDRQGLAGVDWIHIHGNVDVSGVSKKLDALRGRAIRHEDIEAIIEELPRQTLNEYASQFDAVVSTCLLSQIIEHAIGIIGEDHPQMLDLIKALRAQHFMAMIDACKPGGMVALVYDLVSSVTLPAMIGTQGEDLKAVLNKAIQNQNFFHGMNPIAIADALKTDPLIAPSVENLRGTEPWVWDAVSRYYAVAALAFDRRV
ncbi:MAG TPA: hypothetical protein PKD64_07365 [Pirellulaceae bacterium]|nr:hypothetical protein [Pirellulaceae bacterium]HMO92004.1 hypothetical protein [Pirellulaceae bacterium]HMP68803.1 hypothetical protein [Pirellulaceae bacterium]